LLLIVSILALAMAASQMRADTFARSANSKRKSKRNQHKYKD
jgi:hypothetical protein